MRGAGTGGGGRLSPLYPHLKRCYELRNEIHGAVLWLEQDEGVSRERRKYLSQYIKIARTAMSDALAQLQEWHRMDNGLWAEMAKEGGKG